MWYNHLVSLRYLQSLKRTNTLKHNANHIFGSKVEIHIMHKFENAKEKKSLKRKIERKSKKIRLYKSSYRIKQWFRRNNIFPKEVVLSIHSFLVFHLASTEPENVPPSFETQDIDQ